MPNSSPQRSGHRRLHAVPDLPHEALDDREWDERVARAARHEVAIEKSFDRAEECAGLGDFERALEWLDRATMVCGGMPPTYRAQRALWVRTAELQRAGT